MAWEFMNCFRRDWRARKPKDVPNSSRLLRFSRPEGSTVAAIARKSHSFGCSGRLEQLKKHCKFDQEPRDISPAAVKVGFGFRLSSPLACAAKAYIQRFSEPAG